MTTENWRRLEASPPHDKHTWVAIIHEIRDNRTGEVRRANDEAILNEETGEPSTYIWSDGNFSCDCNRQLFFWRAGGEDDTREHQCGHERFSVRLINPETGRVFYDEFDCSNTGLPARKEY
jgi:hypothetical protein